MQETKAMKRRAELDRRLRIVLGAFHLKVTALNWDKEGSDTDDVDRTGTVRHKDDDIRFPLAALTQVTE